MKFLKKAELQTESRISGCLHLGMAVSGKWLQTGMFAEDVCEDGKCSPPGLCDWLHDFKVTETHWIVHVKWVDFKVKNGGFNGGNFYFKKLYFKKSTVCPGLWIYLNRKTFLSPHCRPVLPLTWALPLTPTNNKGSLLQNWKTKTGENAEVEPGSNVQDCHLSTWPSFSLQTRWLLTTKEDPATVWI